ncbi:MAG: type II CRISPR RNA-guided endonuclease Cas9 [Cytophagales bacterium]|nr:MAG: type II CRISPR RNA-guided endonuclease Cas9 [Cytophagales bacterium]TAF60191.1 MAG: type II CRISPR RNA-guided endonuclease Cas9 [Cytophagales bacterium]
MENFQKTRKILGLDLGSASIGYAMIEMQGTELLGLVQKHNQDAIGVRVLPTSGDVLKDFNNGKSVSDCAERTKARGTRRMVQRFRARRERLLLLLKGLGWIHPSFPCMVGREHEKQKQEYKVQESSKLSFVADKLQEIALHNGWAAQQLGDSFVKSFLSPQQVRARQRQFAEEFAEYLPQGFEFNLDLLVYYLRHIGISQKLDKAELALVLYHLNQRRGFKSSRKEAANLQQSKNNDNNEDAEDETEEELAQEGKDYYVKAIAQTGNAKNYQVTLEDAESGESFENVLVSEALKRQLQDHQESKHKIALVLSFKKNKYQCSLPKAKSETVTIEYVQVKFVKELEKEIIKNKTQNPLWITLESDRREGKTYAKLEAGKFYHLQITETITAKGEKTISFKRVSANDWSKNKDKVKRSLEELEQEGKFVAWWHLSNILGNLKDGQKYITYSTNDQVILRKFYENELLKIWETQTSLHGEPLATRQQIEHVLSLLYTNDEQNTVFSQKNKWGKSFTITKNGKTYKDNVRRVMDKGEDALLYLLRKHIIYYQRSLKSQVSQISTCRYETQIGTDGSTPVPVRCAPQSAPYAVEYRLWNEINNLKYTEKGSKEQPFSNEQRATLFGLLCKNNEVKVRDIARKVLQKDPRNVEFNKSQDAKIKGHGTRKALEKALSKAEKEDKNKLEVVLNDTAKLEKLWHMLYSIEADIESEPIENPIVKALRKHFGFSEQAAVELSKVAFKSEHSALSKRAIMKLLPLMRCGKYYQADLLPKQALERLKKIEDNEEETSLDPKTLKRFKENLKLEGLMQFEAASLVYGSHSRESIPERLEKPEDLMVLKQHTLRNPLVEKIVNETLLLVKELWQRFGRPDEIRIELAREMRMTAKERADTTKRISDNQKANDEVKKKIASEIANPSKNDLLRYMLWQESNETCLYSGQKIKVEHIFNLNQTQVDHIIPRSRFSDDSRTNKVLVLSEENKAKSDQTAYDYMQSKGTEALEQYKKRVDDLYKGKKQKRKYLMMTAADIPQDFASRQLNETRYITKKCKELLRAVSEVWVTSGGITDYLRHIWGVDTLMKELIRPRYEANEELLKLIVPPQKDDREEQLLGFSKRLDHRHHALDALIVACTMQGHVQLINQQNVVYTQLSALNKNSSLDSQIVTNQLSKIPEANFKGHADEIKQLVLDWTRRYNNSSDEDSKKEKRRKRLTNFSPPKPNFRQFTKNAMEQLVVSVKSKKETRGELHEETTFGEVWVQEEYQLAEVLAILDKARKAGSKEQEFVRIPQPLDWLKKELNNRLEAHKTLKKAQESLKTAPIKNSKGQELKVVTLLESILVVRRKLGDGLTAPQIKGIVDKSVQEEIIQHLLGGSIPDGAKALKEKLSQENIVLFNDKRKEQGKPPILKVRTRVAYLQADILDTNVNSGHKKYHSKGNNYCFVVGRVPDKEGFKRVYGSVPLFDAVQLRSQGLKPEEPFLTEEKAKLLFTLVQNDTVICLEEGERLEEVNWNNRQELSKKLFRVKKFSKKQLYLSPLNMSQAIAYKPQDTKEGKNSEEKSLFEPTAEKYPFKPLMYKLKISRLGHVEGYWNEEGEYKTV